LACSERPPGKGAGAAGSPLAACTLAEVIELLAERTPSPGGGTAAALAGATAAALTEMAAAFALTRAPDAALTRQAGRAVELRAVLLGLADADRSAYQPVLAARALPRGDPRRASALPAALSTAARVPLEIAAAAAAVTDLASDLVRAPGNDALAGDASVAIILAEAATSAAATLVCINLEHSPADARAGEARRLARGAAERRAALAGPP